MKIASRKIDGNTYIFPKELREFFSRELTEEYTVKELEERGLVVPYDFDIEDQEDYFYLDTKNVIHANSKISNYIPNSKWRYDFQWLGEKIPPSVRASFD